MCISKCLSCGLFCLCYGNASMAQSDTDSLVLDKNTLNVSLSSELNIGHRYYGNDRSVIDLPHFVLDVEANLNKGISISAEIEYERMYEDGEWNNSFIDNFSVNKLYINKQISSGANIKTGIIEVPVGLVNSYGSPLTIYDPESESGILPMTWRETGLAFWGEKKKLRYEISLFACLHSPLRKSHLIGGSARLDYSPNQLLRFGLSGYYGRASRGLSNDAFPDFINRKRLCYSSVDFTYSSKGFVADGSAVYCSDGDTKSFGMEVGYNLLNNNTAGMQLTPFVRCDAIYGSKVSYMRKYTLGVNASPCQNFLLKVEYGIKHYRHNNDECSLNFSIGYAF